MKISTLALAVAALPAAALAQPSDKATLTLADAMRVIESGKAEAVRLHAGAVIAVVDQSGLLIAQERMDDPDMLASVELAPGKARAAALFKKPSADLENAIDGGRLAAVTAPGFTQMAGGVPIVMDGRIVGAVGASASTPAQDKQIAEAAAGALTKGR